MISYEPWQYEYVYFKHPACPTGTMGCSDDESSHRWRQMQRIMSETDFGSHDAKVFKAGWDAASHAALSAISEALHDAGVKE